MRTPSLRHLLTLVLAVVALLASGCSDTDGGAKAGGADTSALAARLTAAQKTIADSPGLDISLKTTQLPSGVTGLLSASGRGYQGETAADAAFSGNVTVVTGGSSLKAEIVATGGKVYAKAAITGNTFLAIDPQTLQAPDPASLLGAKGEGLPAILTTTDDLAEKGKSRDGKTVLTTITGTIAGNVIKTFLPSADKTGTFTVAYRISDDDVLTDATITGPFYPGGADVEYTVVLNPTDDDSPITQP